MGIYRELNRNPTRRDLLQFGLIFLAGTGVLGAVNYFYLGHARAAIGLWIAGGVVFLLALVPKVGRLLYIAWMGLGLTIGFITAPIIMFVVYAIAFVPLGVVFRLMRRDTMHRKLDPEVASYWEDYPKNDGPVSYIRQY